MLDVATLSSELLVLHYETFRSDPVSEAERVLKFVRFPEADPERRACARRFPEVMTRRRRRLADEDVTWCPEAARALEEAVDQVARVFEERGLPPLPLQHYGQYQRGKRRTEL